MVSVEAVANIRANDMASSATKSLLVTVLWQRLMQKDRSVRELTTGSPDSGCFFIEDEDRDPLSLDKMNNADDIKWYLADNEAADPGTRR